jgi:hypothetical protein
MAERSSPAPWTVRSSVEAAFRLGLANFTTFFAVALIFGALGFVVEMRGVSGIPKLLADLVSHVGAYICLVCATLHALDDHVLDLQGTLRQIARPSVRRLIGLGLIQAFAIVVCAILVVPALYLMTIWAVAMPVLLVEDTDIRDSFVRSQELTSGRRWRVFGASIVSTLIVVVAFGSISLILNAIPIVAERDELQSLLRWIIGAAVATFVYPLSAILYVLLRQEKEGTSISSIVGTLH